MKNLGLVSTTVNEDTKRKVSGDEPENGDKPRSARKRKQQERNAINKKIGLLIDRQLSFNGQKSKY